MENCALAIHPSAPRTIFAGTYDDGVWRSTDGGGSWKRVLFGGKDLPDRHATINALAIDPLNAMVVYAATDTGFNAGVWRSADGGNTWAQHTAGLPNNFRLNALALDPKRSGTLYVGASGEGVFKSTDAGKTWVATGDALRRELVIRWRWIQRSPTRSMRARSTRACSSRSTAATWVPAGAEAAARVLSLRRPVNPAIVWAGLPNALMRSGDGGGPNRRPPGERARVVDRARPSVIIAGTTRDGVLRSEDS
jgi:photosystem II stability/assembly factor-like uncharacterized protein